MRASAVLMNAAKKAGPKKVSIPVEMYPLFGAVAAAVSSGIFFTYRHFKYDKELRLWQNANLSNLDNVLNEAEKENKQ